MKNFDQMEPIFFTPPSGKASGPRRLYKGKGGGGGNTEEMMRQQMAQQAEQFRQTQANTPSRAVVEAAADYPAEQERKKEAARLNFYSGTGYNDPAAQAAREAQYKTMSNDIIGYHRTKLDRERNDALRQLGFNLARQGLSGSSQDAYDREQLQRKYLEGVTDINSKASNASAQAKSGFEQAISRGLQAINSGSDAGTQITSALQEKANTLQQAIEGAKGATWGGFFSDLASTVDSAKVRAQQANVRNQVGGSNPLLSGGGSSGGGGSKSGYYAY